MSLRCRMSQKVSRRLGIRNPLVNGIYLGYNVVIRSPKNESKAQRKGKPEIHHQKGGVLFSPKKKCWVRAGYLHDSPFRMIHPSPTRHQQTSAFWRWPGTCLVWMSEPGRCLPHRRWRRDDLPPVAECGLVLWFLVPCDLMKIQGVLQESKFVSFQVCRNLWTLDPFTANQKVLIFFPFQWSKSCCFSRHRGDDGSRPLPRDGPGRHFTNSRDATRVELQGYIPSWKHPSFVHELITDFCLCVFFSVVIIKSRTFFWGRRVFFWKICLLWFDVSDSDGRWWCSPQAGYYFMVFTT